MSATFYRRYRPQRFSDLLGQEAITTTLQQALLQDRLGHAYLFSGPRGTGKTSTARIFARAIVCLDPITSTNSYEPCNKCEACKLILENQTPDLLEVDAASNRGIEDIRELREQVQYHPLQLKRKIYIIDEVHMLTTEAFNALLKTLEEPPAHSLFILATTELHKVPLTIRSRCQLLRFQRASEESLIKKLKEIAKKEKLTVEAEVYPLLAEQADGAFRDAETLFESLSTQHSELTVAVIREALGVLPTQEAQALLEASLAGQDQLLIPALAKLTNFNQGTIERLLHQLIEQVRSKLKQNQKENSSLKLLTYALEQFLEAYILQRSAPIPSLPLEIACLNICQHATMSAIRPVPEKTEKIAHQGSITSTVNVLRSPLIADKVQPTSPATAPVVELNIDGIRDPRKAWKTMIEKICLENMVLGQALKQAVFHTAENGVITIHVRYKFHVDKMNEKKNQKRILALLEELSGQAWSVEYIVSSTLPRQPLRKEIGEGIKDEAEAVFGKS